jgi:site-specific recombinase XerD
MAGTTPENTAPARGRAKTVLPTEFEALMADYNRYLAKALPGQTARTYSSAVRVFLGWLGGGSADGQPLDDKSDWSFAVRDYKAHLLTTLRRSPATANKALAALDNFGAWKGLGEARNSDGRKVTRHDIPRRAPKALEPRARTRYVRAVEACDSARDRLMALLPLYAGLRVSEVAGLDVDDITMSARRGSLRIVGKGTKVRTVPVNPKLRDAITQCMAVRPETDDKALFLTRLGTRPTPEAVDDVIASICQRAGLDEHVTAHTLRHTFGTTLVRGKKGEPGTDIVTVAELMGHASIETTRLYSRPGEEDMQAAVDRLVFDD